MIIGVQKGLGKFQIAHEDGGVFSYSYKEIELARIKLKPYSTEGGIALHMGDDVIELHNFIATPSMTCSVRDLVMEITEHKRSLTPCNNSQIRDLRKIGVALW